MSELGKIRAIADMVTYLRSRFGESAFEVTDHWDDDGSAIGLVAPAWPGRLVYISASEPDSVLFYVELELPPEPGTDFPYKPAGAFRDVDLERLASVVRDHLHLQG